MSKMLKGHLCQANCAITATRGGEAGRNTRQTAENKRTEKKTARVSARRRGRTRVESIASAGGHTRRETRGRPVCSRHPQKTAHHRAAFGDSLK